jgi:hypothetical protein
MALIMKSTFFWNSVVSIATGHSLKGTSVRVRVPVGSSTFSSLRRSDRLWWPSEPPIPGSKVAGT